MDWFETIFGLIFGFMMFGVPVLVVAAIFFGRRHKDKQKRLWRNWAVARNWGSHDTWPAMLEHYGKGELIPSRGGTASYGFEGTFDGQAVAGFEYRYTTGSGKNRSTTYKHICMVRIPGAQFPGLTLNHENFASRLLGGRDIQFEDARFNENWFVKGDVPRFAHDIVHPRVMHWLNSRAVPPLSMLWFDRDAIIMSTERTLDPALIDFNLRFLTSLVATVPRHVWEDIGVRLPPVVTDAGPGVPMSEQQRRIASYNVNDQP